MAMIDLSDIVLKDADGRPVRLGDVIDRPTVIDRVRYYGCAPCRSFLRGLADRSSRLEDGGAGALGVGPHAAYQARGLQRDGIDFPLLLDPDHRLAAAIGQGRMPLWRFILDVRGWVRWWRAFLRSRQGVITGGWWELPAVIVTDEHARVRWTHHGRFIGDYPDVDQVVAFAMGTRTPPPESKTDMNGPNPVAALFSILRARRLRRPRPLGRGAVDHADLDPLVRAVADHGVAGLEPLAERIQAYVDRLAGLDPDFLTRDEALAYWLNLYNAGALDLARRTFAAGDATVLRIPGAFTTPFVRVAGESLSLDGIEHGKIRRFGDPRIHAALVCGSASCPTLRPSAYTGDGLAAQLDDQMRSFLASGASATDREQGVLRLSRVFLWYGGDFVRPHRMPSLLPVGKSRVRDALVPWLPEEMQSWVRQTAPKVTFMDYDWGLGCSVR
jgi:hypothetical protein